MTGCDHAVVDPYFSDEAVTLYPGDCLVVLRSDELGYDWSLGYGTRRLIPDGSVDAVITDPPYGLGFMGKSWDQPGEFGSRRRVGNPGVHRRAVNRADDQIGDTGAMEAGRYDLSTHAMRNFQRWCEIWAVECLRVLKPGGHLIAFGGSRTWHRLASAIEDAGFEVRDSIAWLYGSGFPKSRDVSKAIDQAAGAERDVIHAGAPVKRMIPGAHQNATGSWIKDNGRRFTPTVTAPATDSARQWQGWGTTLKPSFEPIVVARKPLAGTVAQNVQTHGTGALNIDGCRVATAGAPELSIAGREGPANRRKRGSADDSEVAKHVESRTCQERFWQPGHGEVLGRWPTNVVLDDAAAAALDQQSGTLAAGNHPAKRSGRPVAEKVYGTGWSGTEGERRATESGGASRFFPIFRYAAKATAAERPCVDGVVHPTVKPLGLMRWLVRLTTPPHGVVLDPFGGSGTTAEACIHEHMRCITIERDAGYLSLIKHRLTKPMDIGFDFGEAL